MVSVDNGLDKLTLTPFSKITIGMIVVWEICARPQYWLVLETPHFNDYANFVLVKAFSFDGQEVIDLQISKHEMGKGLWKIIKP